MPAKSDPSVARIKVFRDRNLRKHINHSYLLNIKDLRVKITVDYHPSHNSNLSVKIANYLRNTKCKIKAIFFINSQLNLTQLN